MTRMRWLLVLVALTLVVPVQAQSKIAFATYASGAGTP